MLFVGTLNQSLVHPREVFKEAFLCSACFIICVHNHPTNQVKPSKEDLELTKRLFQIGMLQGIPILDHIIVGKNKYYSLFEENQMGG